MLSKARQLQKKPFISLDFKQIIVLAVKVLSGEENDVRSWKASTLPLLVPSGVEYQGDSHEIQKNAEQCIGNLGVGTP